MTMTTNDPHPHHLDTRRAELVAYGGLSLQGFAALLCLLFSWLTQSAAYGLLRWQAALGIVVWALTVLHLRLRRQEQEERIDLEEAERRRRAQGMETLFEQEEEGPCARNLRHMDSVLAPAASLLLGLGLLLPLGLFLLKGAPWTLAAESLQTGYLLPSIVGGLFMAFSLFLLGMYASGLGRQPAWRVLRAGAGYSLVTALGSLVTALGFTLITQGWMGGAPDMVIKAALLGWMSLHGLEILVNLVLDFYRPRVPGQESRPGYDSRLSGLFAEPDGIVRTFAHTLDYQFGFSISETWFFRFLEKAFLPLLCIQIGMFYLLTSFVVVRPGEVAVVERWGAPRGVKTLPESDADWESLPAPLGPGVHLKWPWPVETAKLMNREKISDVTIGYHVENAEDAAQKAETLRTTIVTWDTVHVKDETQYLMPLPTPEGGTADTRQVDALLLSGEFRIEYRIGTRAGDPYRYLYRYRTPQGMIRTIFEREVTEFLAGADFWDILARAPEKMRDKLTDHLQEAFRATGLGIELLYVGISNLHPPAGEVGKAYQEVIASQQDKETEIHKGWIDANQIVGLAPSEADQIRSAAEATRFEREVTAKKQAEWFLSQLTAYQAAPQAHMTRLRMRMLEEALRDTRKVLAPRDTLIIIDDTRTVSPMNLEKAIIKEATK